MARHYKNLNIGRTATGLILLLYLVASGLCADGWAKANQTVFPAFPKPDGAVLTLTADQQAWLSEHRVIRVVQDPAWPPIEFADKKGNPTGMTADYIRIIEQRLGVRFEWVRNLSWQEAYSRLKRHEIDMTTSVAETAERKQFWTFTRPYMSIPIVIVAKADVTFIADMRELDGKKVAVVEGYAVNDWIPRDFPKIDLIRYKSVEECLKALQRHEVFAYVDNMLVVGYYLARMKMTTLTIAGETPYVNAQCMAVRNDWAPLAGILQKALDSISENERNDIYRRWLPVRYEHGFDYTLLWYALGVFALILSGLILWNWKLSREIQARKAAEKALKNSEDRFQVVFESANVGKSITLPTGEINVNQAFCNILGYSPEELQNKIWQDLTPPEDIPAIQNLLTPLLEGKKDEVRFNKRYLRKDGSIIWTDVSVAIQRDAGRTPLYFITTVIDITDRILANEALAESLGFLNQIIDNTPNPMWISDAEGTVIRMNNALKRLLQVKDEEILGIYNVLKDLQVKDQGLLPLVQSVFSEGKTVEFSIDYDTGREQQVSLKKTTARILEIILAPIADHHGKITNAIALHKDITERRQMEDHLRASEERFRRMFQHSALGMVLVSPTFRFLEVNEAFCNMLGYSREELLEKTFQDITIPEDRPTGADLVGEVLAGKRETFWLEKRYRLKDGGEIWGLVSATLIRDAENEPLHFVGLIQDISTRKKAEEQREAALEENRRLNEALEKKVHERTAELRETVNRLEELNRIFVGRELRMMELKKRIEELENGKRIS